MGPTHFLREKPCGRGCKTPTRCRGLLENPGNFRARSQYPNTKRAILRSNKLFHFVLLHAGKTITHFTVTGGNEARVDLVLIQPLWLYYVALMPTSIFKPNLH